MVFKKGDLVVAKRRYAGYTITTPEVTCKVINVYPADHMEVEVIDKGHEYAGCLFNVFSSRFKKLNPNPLTEISERLLQ